MIVSGRIFAPIISTQNSEEPDIQRTRYSKSADIIHAAQNGLRPTSNRTKLQRLPIILPVGELQEARKCFDSEDRRAGLRSRSSHCGHNSQQPRIGPARPGVTCQKPGNVTSELLRYDERNSAMTTSSQKM
jgi:hypothetical protein